MLRILRPNDPTDVQVVAKLMDRSSNETAVEPRVREILQAVRENGDEALLALTKRFDGISLSPDELKVTEREIEAAAQALDPTAKAAQRSVSWCDRLRRLGSTCRAGRHPIPRRC